MMVFFWIFLISVLEILVIFAAGMLGSLKNFKMPWLLVQIVSTAPTLFFITLKAWLLFDYWYWNFFSLGLILLLGAVSIGLFFQAISKNLTSEKNQRANIQIVSYHTSNSGVVTNLLGYIPLTAAAAVIWLAFDAARIDGVVMKENVPFATFVYFTLGSVPGIIASSITNTRMMLDPTVGPVARNVGALASLIGWLIQGWRAIFPLVTLQTSFEFALIDFELSNVTIGYRIIYFFLAIVPMIIGARAHAEEREKVRHGANGLLKRVELLNDGELEDRLLRPRREILVSELDQFLTNLIRKDSVLKNFALCRWVPLPAYHVQGDAMKVRGIIREDARTSSEIAKQIAEWGDDDPADFLYHSVLARQWYNNVAKKGRFQINKWFFAVKTTMMNELASWNYRIRALNELVPILEEFSENTPKARENAKTLSKLARANLEPAYAEASRQSSFIAIFTFILTNGVPFVVTNYKEQWEEIRPIVVDALPFNIFDETDVETGAPTGK